MGTKTERRTSEKPNWCTLRKPFETASLHCWMRIFMLACFSFENKTIFRELSNEAKRCWLKLGEISQIDHWRRKFATDGRIRGKSIERVVERWLSVDRDQRLMMDHMMAGTYKVTLHAYVLRKIVELKDIFFTTVFYHFWRCSDRFESYETLRKIWN